MEHRWGQRLIVDLPAIVELPDRSIVARVRDASLSGAYVLTRSGVSQWAHLSLRFVSLLSILPERKLNACVVRSDGSGVGIEWTDFAPDEIRELLAHMPSATPAVLYPPTPDDDVMAHRGAARAFA